MGLVIAHSTLGGRSPVNGQPLDRAVGSLCGGPTVSPRRAPLAAERATPSRNEYGSLEPR